MAKKGQTFSQYTDEIKAQAVRLRLEGVAYSHIREKLGIKSDAQIVNWVRKHESGESSKDLRGHWSKKHFNSIEEENAYLKAQVEYLRKLNPNLHGEGSRINKPGSESSRNESSCRMGTVRA
jgi:transposase